MDQIILKSHVEKPEKFKGSDFRRWQQKMLFYLTSLHVSYVLTDSEPVDPYLVDGQNVPTEAQMADYERAASQWNHNEYNCRNYILNALDDSLYDIYSTFATAREIWESLENKYKTQVACSMKFVIGKFLNFKMNDAKHVVMQVEELQIIVHEMEVEGMGINSNFLVGSIIEKLPQSWKNFKLYLKHLTNDMSFEQLVFKIRVEEDNMMIEKADANSLRVQKNSAAYRFLVYKSNVEDISNNTIIESAKAEFFENIFPYKDKEKQISNLRKRVMNDQLSQDETDNNYDVPQENVEPRRSKRAKVTKDFGPDYMT
ncbi:hypothetical protein Tco_0033802 [Tanacetum coccineum]